MNLSIDTNSAVCPFGMPVAIWDLDTRELVGCYKDIISAQKTLALLTGTDPTTDVDLFARAAISLPPTVTW